MLSSFLDYVTSSLFMNNMLFFAVYLKIVVLYFGLCNAYFKLSIKKIYFYEDILIDRFSFVYLRITLLHIQQLMMVSQNNVYT